jgi:hypothetical protein
MPADTAYCYHCGKHHPIEEMRQVVTKGGKRWRCIKSIEATKKPTSERDALRQHGDLDQSLAEPESHEGAGQGITMAVTAEFAADQLSAIASPETQRLAARMAQDAFAGLFRLTLSGDLEQLKKTLRKLNYFASTGAWPVLPRKLGRYVWLCW